MTSPVIGPYMTPVQLQTAYRLAVQACLVVFFSKDEAAAKHIVDDWWHQMLKGSGVENGMYLHSEAFSTAADLARVKEPDFTDDSPKRYFQIIHECTRLALARDRKPSRSSKQLEMAKQMVG